MYIGFGDMDIETRRVYCALSASVSSLLSRLNRKRHVVPNYR